jgi:hypothetical protein
VAQLSGWLGGDVKESRNGNPPIDFLLSAFRDADAAKSCSVTEVAWLTKLAPTEDELHARR